MEAVTLPRRELTILAVALAAAARLVDGLLGWFVVGCVFVAVLLGARSVLAPAPVRLVRFSLILPALVPLVLPSLAAAGGAGAVHALGFDGWLLVALAAVGVIVERTLVLEAAIAEPQPAAGVGGRHVPVARPRGTDDAEVLGLALVVAFVAFVGAGALVPGGLAEPGSAAASPAALTPGWLVALTLADAVVAALIGLRLSALRTSDARDIAWSAATYAAIVGVAAAALRALAMPRFLGPALLTLLLYLWSAYRGSTRATRRSARWIWESVLLAFLVVAVVAWNVVVRP